MRVPEWECFDHDGGRGVFGRHGVTQDQPVRDLGQSGRESGWQWKGFVGMPLVHPNGSARPWVPWCGYNVLPLQSVFNLSIVTSVLSPTIRSTLT